MADQVEDIWENVQVCPVHPAGQMPNGDDCKGCEAEVVARTAVIDQLQADASNRAQGLAQQGIQMPQAIYLSMKVDLLVECLFTDRRTRLQFEGEFGRRVLAELKDAQRMATQQTLAPQKNLTVVRNGYPKPGS